ncbi:g9666 [Coccomyxa viridis]|uniref:G9666 protein n=1 Tax=Coccomyxa viridis TaxID=1274662 RepID=A0ABP1G3K7_9CHLO
MSANAAASDIETGERQSTHHEASARTASTSHTLFRTDTLRRAFISLCLVDLVTVIAIGAFMVQQWRGPPWNAPIWPMIPLLLNRSIEVAALCLKNVFTSITTSAVQVFLAVINLILCTQRMPCENSMKTCIGSILAVSILVLEILIAVIVTLWINWAHFMSWASAGSHEMMLAAQGLAGREHSAGVGVSMFGSGQAGRRTRGTPKKFIQVVQPGEDSFALAIVVDATGRAGDAPRFPVGKETEGATQQQPTAPADRVQDPPTVSQQ